MCSVDGTHCQIQEPRSRPNKNWYSHKFEHPGVSYEIGVDLFTSRIVWLNGPFQAGDTDLVIFRKPDGLKSKIPANCKVIADKGYIGEAKASTKNEFDSDELKEFKRRARDRHESMNGRIKLFAVLTDTFRHPLLKHEQAFEAVCVLVQYTLENEHPLFAI